MTKGYVICGIGTDCGKTTAAVLLAQYFKQREQAYPRLIKPVQTGGAVDTDFYSRCQIPATAIKNYHTFATAVSPHLAQELAGQAISFTELTKRAAATLLTSDTTCLFELAGGELAPITRAYSNRDFIKKLRLPVILVAANYIGAINHTLLTIENLRQHAIPVAGFLYNHVIQDDLTSADTLAYLKNSTALHCIGEIPYFPDFKQALSDETSKKNVVKDWSFADEKD